jgi:hypothetical protein
LKLLKRTLKLSAPTAGTSFYFTAVKPKNGTDLTSRDVPGSWLSSAGDYLMPTTAVPLSGQSLSIEVRFGYGVRSSDLLIPLSDNGIVEGNEIVALQQQYSDFGSLLPLSKVADKH